MAAPTYIQEAETAWNTTTTPKGSGNFTTQTVDVVVAPSVREDASDVGPGLAQTGTNVTLASQQEVNVSAYTLAEISAGVVASGGTTSVSFAQSGSDSATKWFGGNALTFRGSDGIGASAKTNVSSGAPSLNITTTQDNSAIVVVVGDWNAADGASRTWRTVNSITPTAGNGYELTYFRDASHYAVYIAYYPDAGTAGSKTVGLSAPSGQKYSIVALEVKGTAGGDVSVALTGVSATGAVGNLGDAVSYALSGNAATGAVGSVGDAVSYALTGNSASGALGTVAPSVVYGLTGVSGTGAVGSVSVQGGSTEALTGVAATGAVGSVASSITYALTGVSATGAAGSLAAESARALSGNAATGAVGSLGDAISYGLTGVGASGQVGTLSIPGDITIALTGVQAVGQVGTLTPSGDPANLPGGGSGGYPPIVAYRRLRQRELRELERLRALEDDEKRIRQAIERAQSEKAVAKEQRRKAKNQQEQQEQRAVVEELATQIAAEMLERDDEDSILAFLEDEDAHTSNLVMEFIRKVEVLTR